MPAPDRIADILDADHRLLCAAVREAGALALSYFGSDVAHWKKAGDSPVSEADLAVDRLLHDQLLSARPDYGWLSEETADDRRRLACRDVFIIDPIDGTRAFLKGKPHFTVCAALVRDGRPVAAAVYNPALDQFFDAIAGGGSRLNGAPIRVSSRAALPGCRMASHAPMFKHPAWSLPWPDMEVIERNSVAYRLALVASGEVDAALALSGKSDWDIAAAELIVAEAGGTFTRHDGRAFVYNGDSTRHPSVMAANPALHAKLLERVGALNIS